MEQQTGSKQEKEYVKAVYCPPCLFNLYAEYIMRNAGLVYQGNQVNFPWESDMLAPYVVDGHLASKQINFKE